MAPVSVSAFGQISIRDNFSPDCADHVLQRGFLLFGELLQSLSRSISQCIIHLTCKQKIFSLSQGLLTETYSQVRKVPNSEMIRSPFFWIVTIIISLATLQSLYTSFMEGVWWLFIIAALFPPVAIIHGFGVWLAVW